ncbi:hypothetical protein M408DRAFT_317176 [Serendipita vermifera MAFF 305830]|uniref:C2 domain-containing protein n=1 Tax=Serendipita vermifera MAFF 305830 TaxID=933852 RepID=A0A0C3AXE2_SERVB|nr:hypothetical protein M408DRAFT_317176 [Serendipita vermifera MAFF 305830]
MSKNDQVPSITSILQPTYAVNDTIMIPDHEPSNNTSIRASELLVWPVNTVASYTQDQTIFGSYSSTAAGSNNIATVDPSLLPSNGATIPWGNSLVASRQTNSEINPIPQEVQWESPNPNQWHPIQQHDPYTNPNAYVQSLYGGFVTSNALGLSSQYPQQHAAAVSAQDWRKVNPETLPPATVGQQNWYHTSDLPMRTVVQNSKIKFTVVSAFNLVKTGFLLLPDPFAVVTVGGQTYTTSVIKKSVNPHWNEGPELIIDLGIETEVCLSTVTDSSVVTVQVFDQRSLKGSDRGFLGGVLVKVDDALGPESGGFKTLTMNLQSPSKGLSFIGQITLHLLSLVATPPRRSRSLLTGALPTPGALTGPLAWDRSDQTGSFKPIVGAGHLGPSIRKDQYSDSLFAMRIPSRPLAT